MRFSTKVVPRPSRHRDREISDWLAACLPIGLVAHNDVRDSRPRKAFCGRGEATSSILDSVRKQIVGAANHPSPPNDQIDRRAGLDAQSQILSAYFLSSPAELSVICSRWIASRVSHSRFSLSYLCRL